MALDDETRARIQEVVNTFDRERRKIASYTLYRMATSTPPLCLNWGRPTPIDEERQDNRNV